MADRHGLGYVTFPELVPAGPRRAALALSFDDTYIHEWFGLRELFAAHGARVTFWVTRYAETTLEARAELATLRADGHAVEPHGTNHLDAVEYTRDRTIADYVAEEIVPSIELLRADGYTPTSFAWPRGHSNAELDRAALEVVDRVRVSPGSCPH